MVQRHLDLSIVTLPNVKHHHWVRRIDVGNLPSKTDFCKRHQLVVARNWPQFNQRGLSAIERECG